jgi:hypothetical protein
MEPPSPAGSEPLYPKPPSVTAELSSEFVELLIVVSRVKVEPLTWIFPGGVAAS